MKRGSLTLPGLTAAILSIGVLAAATAAQVAGGPAVRRERGDGLEVRFVAYPWRPDVFAAFEEGRSPVPASWAFARLDLQGTFRLGDRKLSPGRYAMILTPKTGTLPMTFELRRFDGRELFADPTVMPPPPPGETAYKAPATFARDPEPSPTLDVTVASYRGEGSVVTIRYGDRRLVQELTPAEP